MPPAWDFIMNFKQLAQWFLFSSLMILLTACSDEARETELVNLHATADQDVTAIEFPATTETVVSINSLTAFSVQGVKSNGVDRVSLASQIEWSLSNGAASSIDKNGRLTAAATAESITVYAKLGILSTSIDIRISEAKFDRVVSLNPDDKLPVSIEMCQSQTITPFGVYIDASGIEETPRKVDNNVIKTITWSILNKADSSESKNAYITTGSGGTITLHSLAAGDLIVKAKAISAYTGSEVTSDDLSQTIGNGLSSIKICSANASSYASCGVTSDSVEQDKDISFMAIGHYVSGSYQNISRTSKWGISNSNMSAILSSDLQQIDVTGGVVPGETLSTASNLSVACGDIDQTIPDDITQGIILASDISCSTDCEQSSAAITIKQLSVESFNVTANDQTLTSNESLTLTRPVNNEIKLAIKVTFSNGEESDITNSDGLSEEIITINELEVIKQTDTARTYEVLQAGSAKIELNYRGKIFYARLEIL